jgi:hypothetical protein
MPASNDSQASGDPKFCRKSCPNPSCLGVRVAWSAGGSIDVVRDDQQGRASHTVGAACRDARLLRGSARLPGGDGHGVGRDRRVTDQPVRSGDDRQRRRHGRSSSKRGRARARAWLAKAAHLRVTAPSGPRRPAGGLLGRRRRSNGGVRWEGPALDRGRRRRFDDGEIGCGSVAVRA